MSNYVLQRNNTFYYRRRIPKEFTYLFSKKSEFRLKMVKKTHLSAILKSKTINLLFEEMINMLHLDTFDKKEKIVDDYISLMHDSIKENYYSDKNTLSIHDLEYEQLECKHSIRSGNSHLASSQIDEVFNYANIDKEDVDISTYEQIKKLYLHKKLNMLENIIHNIEPKNDFTRNSLSPALEKKANISFQKLYELFMKEKKQESDEDIAESTWRDYQSSYNDFIYVVEDAQSKDISEFSREDFRVYLEALNNHLPKNRTKLQKFKNLPYSKLKELTLSDEEKIAHNTKKKKMSTIKQIFDIALDDRYGYIQKNYAAAFLIKDTKINKRSDLKKRSSISDDNLKNLFSSKLYINNVEYLKKYKPEQYWIPLIAIYSGMRQNEICQLHIEDIKDEIISTKEKVYYFDINEDKDKHLKNKNAFRKVPIHPKLLDLGFLEYFNSVKDKQERLWDNLRFHPTQKRYNIDYGKNFMKYFRRYITQDKKQTFHSMRHNVSTQLLNNAVKYKIPKDLINRILGHEPANDETTQSYFSGYDVEALYEGIRTLDFSDAC